MMCRVLVFKEAPRVVFTGLTKLIGEPRDLETNLANAQYFEKDIDLSIPLEQTKELKPAPVVKAAPAEEKPRASLAATEASTVVEDKAGEAMQSKIREVIGDKDELHYMPIRALNTFSTEWRIKARLTKKHQKKQWKNAKTAGVLLNVELMDQAGTQITATFFNDIAERWDAVLREGAVYAFAGGSVKIANTKYTSIKNDYCIVFDRDSVIEELPEDRGIQAQGFSFVSIEDINDFEQQRTVDAVGVITNVGGVSSFQPKAYDGGAPRPPKDKRSLQLADETGLQIQVTLWGQNATRLPFAEGHVLAIKGAKVSDYGGKSLNAGDEHSQIFLDCEHKRVKELQAWYSANPAASRAQQSITATTSKSTEEGATQRADNFKLIQEVIEAV